MRTPPDLKNKWDLEDLELLNPEPWMVELLNLNPNYCSWGPYEDYMSNESGWGSPVFVESWKDFKGWDLNDLNELVNFYFEVDQPTEECSCGGSGYNPETDQISDDFYDFEGTGRKWKDQITQDEVDKLIEKNRLFQFYPDHETWVKAVNEGGPRPTPTAEEVNLWSKGRGDDHDAINRGILIKCRAKRLGVWGVCEHCKGRGQVITGPTYAGLILWMIHPRKGCGRGVEIKNLKQEDLPEIFNYLAEGAQRNASRFSKVVQKSATISELGRARSLLPGWAEKDPELAEEIICHLVRQGHLNSATKKGHDY